MSLKHSSNEILNSWKKEKLSSSMKFNQRHCILIWKLTSEIRSFFSVWSLRLTLTPTDCTLLSFVLLLTAKSHCDLKGLAYILRYLLFTFLPLNFNDVFILEYIVQSHFVAVLKSSLSTKLQHFVKSIQIRTRKNSVFRKNFSRSVHYSGQ